MTARKSLNEYYTDDNTDDESDDFKNKEYIEISASDNEENKNFSVIYKNYIIGSVLTLLFAIILYFILYTDIFISKTNNIEQVLYNYLSLKKIQFPNQDTDVWGDILNGLTKLKEEPVKPAVYLLMFEEEAIKSSSCIIEIITTSANRYILNSDRWLLLNGSRISEYKTKDPGVLIETLRKSMEYSKVVVITDIQKIPAKLAQGFHFLVDEYNPKIEAAVYIFTLMIPKQEFNASATEIVEEILSHSWTELHNDIRMALISRITTVVLPILQERIIESCPLKINSTIEVSIP